MNLSLFPNNTYQQQMSRMNSVNSHDHLDFEENKSTDLEKKSQLSKPLLEEEYVLLKLLKNPKDFQLMITKLSLENPRLVNHLTKYWRNQEQKEKYSTCRKIFGAIINIILITALIFLLIYSYQQNIVALGAGSLAFLLAHINEFVEILPMIFSYIDLSIAKIFKFLIMFIFSVCFTVLCLEKDFIKVYDENLLLSEALLGISLGFFIALIIIKPIKSFSKEAFG